MSKRRRTTAPLLLLLLILTNGLAAGAEAQGNGHAIIPGGVVEMRPETQFRSKAATSAEVAAGFTLFPTEGERFFVIASLDSNLPILAPATLRVAGTVTSKIQPGYASFGGNLTAGGFLGLASTPLVIDGRRAISIVGSFPDGRKFAIRSSVLGVQMDAIAACTIRGAVRIDYRFRGYQAVGLQPQAVYAFSLDDGPLNGRLQFLGLEGSSLPAPVWVGIEVSNSAYDENFLGLHKFRFLVEGHGLSRDNSYTRFPDRSLLPSCGSE